MPENSCLNVFRLWDAWPYGDPMGGLDYSGGGTARVVAFTYAFFIVNTILCGWYIFDQGLHGPVVDWLPTAGFGKESWGGFILWLLCYFFVLLPLFVVFLLALLKWALKDRSICSTCPRPEDTITIEECGNNVEAARTAAINGCKTDGRCCPDNKVCMSNDDSSTKVMCNPNEIPPQLCPGQKPCPECGGDSCKCPS